MRNVLILLFLSLSTFGYSQIISGTLVSEGRKLLSEATYVHPGTMEGWAIYELAVDNLGNVTSVKLIESTLKSTPKKYELRNYLTSFKFTGGTHYPKFQHVRVKLTVTNKI